MGSRTVRGFLAVAVMMIGLSLCAGPASAADTVADCQAMMASGKYAECLAATTKAIEEKSYGEEWPILKAQSELALGKYPEALATVVAGIERYTWSARLRHLEYECALANGKKEQAAAALMEVEKQVATASWRYTDADDLAAIGWVAIALGADAKAVQEGFFERARKNYSNRPDGFLAAGRLALDKGDFAFAAELLTPAAKEFETNADIKFLLSEAISSADSEQSAQLLQKTLELNPHHVGAMQRAAERQIDSEDYSGAEETIRQMLSVNPHLPEAHALQTVIHQLRNNADAAAQSRAEALKFSAVNPKVDHLIGRKLSQKYRFTEGAAAQRSALELDPEFNPARVQLAQDLLRLGQEAEGWQMAEQAHDKDGYDTTLFNLLQLKDSLGRFTTLKSPHFQVRMEKHEAAVYGQRVLALLEESWAELTPRFEFSPELPVMVEIYPRADDFAVRTFGIPDVSGFLGVCFGKVVTANSPASRRDHPTSWESVLWHEFCHVITLQKTGNKIPRWLSEGISVFEERRADIRWGQHMNHDFRDRILADRITPIGQLSSAFLTAKSGEDMNFAYYESSMVVEHIVQTHGLPALNAVLSDLSTGVQINDALDRHTGGLEALETSFRSFLTEQAKGWAAGVDFSKEAFAEAKPTDLESVKSFLETHPASFAGLMTQASLLLQDNKQDEAEVALKKLVEQVPGDVSTNGPRRLLADVYRKRGENEQEAAVLAEHLARTADDLEAAMRLQDICNEANQSERVIEQGQTIFGIDPFQISAIQKTLAAAETLKQNEVAVAQLSSLLELQSDDAPRLHYRIARMLKESDTAQSRRHVLLALEQAPRFRDAHTLLLELKRAEQATEPAK